MIKIKLLRIQFDTDIEAYEIPAFRGAVIAKTGNEHIIFHNHLNDREFLYGYPVIQYKRIGKNPAIICIDLNQENYEKYQALKDELSQTLFLENILKANIISFAKGVKWDIDKQISLRIDALIKAKIVPYKQQKLLAFDIRFRSNVFLPDFVGLGKGGSLGFGTVSQVKNNR